MKRTSDVGPAPDLDMQLEDIMHAVWLAEREWRLNDRIDLATRLWFPVSSDESRRATPRNRSER